MSGFLLRSVQQLKPRQMNTCAVLEITVMWYYAVGAVVLGFFVAYAAMFGFDKFKQAFEKMKQSHQME